MPAIGDWHGLVRQRFAGRAASEVQRQLEEDGFEVWRNEDLTTHRPIGHAVHVWEREDCYTMLGVDWTQDEGGAVSDVAGIVRQGCKGW